MKKSILILLVSIFCTSVFADMSSEAKDLFYKWIDKMVSLQVKETTFKELDGGILCPSCKWLHGRNPDAVWPLVWAWKDSGDKKYLDAAVKLMAWGRNNMERLNGAWINDPNAKWRGITVFGQTALGRALLYCGNDLPEDVRKNWMDAFTRMTTYCCNWIEDPKTSVNVNYRAAYPLAMEIAYRLLGDEKYRKYGDGQMAIVKDFISDEGFFFGEAAPSDKYSARGFRGVDIGYNVEESLPAMLEWADLRGDKVLMRKFLDCAKAHMPFFLPDGGVDNSFGSRAYKWTYWGSRTSDGSLPMLVYLYRDGLKEAARAMELQLQLYKTCTKDDLLTGGIHYPVSGEPTCIHHTFCHLKTLPMFISEKMKKEVGTKIESEKPFPLKKYRTCGVSICRVGKWRATFSENDLYFWDAKGKATGGGSLTFLWHESLGPVFAANMSEWYLQEPGSMQDQTIDDKTWCFTPRVESADTLLKSVHDHAVAHNVIQNTDGTVISTANGVLADKDDLRSNPRASFSLEWKVSEKGVSADATCKIDSFLVVPIITPSMNEITVDGNKVTLKRNNTTVTFQSNRNFILEKTMRPDSLAFSAQTGFLSAYLKLPIVPGEKTTLQVR